MTGKGHLCIGNLANTCVTIMKRNSRMKITANGIRQIGSYTPHAVYSKVSPGQTSCFAAFRAITALKMSDACIAKGHVYDLPATITDEWGKLPGSSLEMHR